MPLDGLVGFRRSKRRKTHSAISRPMTIRRRRTSLKMMHDGLTKHVKLSRKPNEPRRKPPKKPTAPKKKPKKKQLNRKRKKSKVTNKRSSKSREANRWRI